MNSGENRAVFGSFGFAGRSIRPQGFSMADPSADARETLESIRRLMERATIYRSLSGPAALVGGLLAIGAGIWTVLNAAPSKRPDVVVFFSLWVAILVLAGVFNTWLLLRGAKQRGEELVTPSLKLAIAAFFPPLAAGGLISWILLHMTQSFAICVICWIIFYALALLATANFAPESMRLLGWAFFCAGMVVAVLYFLEAGTYTFQTDAVLAGWFMIATFGVLHLVYAAGITVRARKNAAGTDA